MINPPSLVGFIVLKLGHPRRKNYPLRPAKKKIFGFLFDSFGPKFNL